MTVAAWASGFPPAPAAPAAAIPTEFAANSGWTNASGMTVANSAAYPAPHPSGRTQGLRLQKPTASFGGARTSTLTLPNFKLSDYAVIGFDIYGIVTSGSINLRFSSDNFATKRREVSWSFPNYFINGWQRLTIRPTDDGTTAEGGATWTVTGGQALDEPINAVQVSMSTASSVAMEGYVDRVFGWQNIPARGAVLLGFSSFGESSIIDLALPILTKWGVKSYWAGDGDIAEGANAGRLLDFWYAAGHDVIQSGRNHVDYTSSPSLLAPDYQQTRSYFQQRGWISALDHFVMPFSTSDATTEAIMKSLGIRMAKGVGAASLKPNEWNLNYKLIGHGGLNIGGLTLAQVKKLVDQCVLNGTIKQMFCHGLVSGGDGSTPPADANYWYANDMDALCAYIAGYVAAGRLDAPSPSQLFNKRGALPVVA